MRARARIPVRRRCRRAQPHARAHRRAFGLAERRRMVRTCARERIGAAASAKRRSALCSGAIGAQPPRGQRRQWRCARLAAPPRCVGDWPTGCAEDSAPGRRCSASARGQPGLKRAACAVSPARRKRRLSGAADAREEQGSCVAPAALPGSGVRCEDAPSRRGRALHLLRRSASFAPAILSITCAGQARSCNGVKHVT